MVSDLETRHMGEQKKAPFIHEKALVETDAIGEGTRIWAFAHVLKDAVIGADCNIGDHAFIESGVTIGNNVTIKNGVSVWRHVHVADNVFLGPNAVLTNDLTPRSRDTNWLPVETWIEEGVTIGANATIICGVTLGERCLIGAGAVVTRDVRPHELVYGNPARHRGWVCFCAQSLKPDRKTISNCERCGRKYKVGKSGVQEVA
jgi:UDP-2-acetamido-3-amino-2,3-dideoxy-glucuronate N-acetyltransferase